MRPKDLPRELVSEFLHGGHWDHGSPQKVERRSFASQGIEAKMAFYETLTGKFRGVKKNSYEYNPEGGRDKIELEPVLDQRAIVSRLEDLKKKKDEIEERLADSNFKTMVAFDQAPISKLL